MKWNPRLLVDSSTIEAVQMLVDKSPDLGIDMAVLMWITNKREWYGKYKDWTDLPIDWFAKRCHCRFQRIVNSIERLIEYEMIRPMCSDRMVHKVMKYIYVKHRPTLDPDTYPDKDEIVRELEEEPELQEEPILPTEPEKPIIAAINKTKGTPVPTVPVLYWNGEYMEKRPTPMTEVALDYKCRKCGHHIHPHEGTYDDNYQECFLHFLEGVFIGIDSPDTDRYKKYWKNNGFIINGKKMNIEEAREVLRIALEKWID